MAERVLAAGETLIAEGNTSASVYELRAGTLEVVRSDVTIAVVSDPGALFGELSLLLDRPASASVRARTDATVVEIADARARLDDDPAFVATLARLLARRLDT